MRSPIVGNHCASGLAAVLTSLALLVCADPSSAQIDLSGSWTLQNNQDYQIRVAGPNYADYLGIPLDKDARAAALSYSPDTVEELNRECQPWPLHYLFLGPFGFKVRPTIDSLNGDTTAWTFSGSIDRMPLVIWMDGRAEPGPQAPHTPGGFTTGRWLGDTLVATTTHLRDGFLTRNGVPSSNRETITMFITRHGDLMTITAIIRDPVYLTTPYILSRTWQFDPSAGGLFTSAAPMNCTPEEEDPGISNGRYVATFLPDTNPLLHVMPDTYHIPLAAALGGEQTMFPEFTKTLRNRYVPPATYCKTECCGTGTSAQFDARVLHCANSNGQ